MPESRPPDEIYFLTFDDICAIHDRALEEFNQGMPGFLDENVVRSAAGQPEQALGSDYFYEFPAGMAAAYLYFLVNQQGFLNGNKRTAVGAALEFLAQNGYKLAVTSYELYEFTRHVAGEDVKGDRKVILAEITGWVVDHLEPLD
jgi:death-on-curing protein